MADTSVTLDLEEIMSVIIALCLRDGIIMAADSCVTTTLLRPDGSEEKRYSNKSQKIFQLGKRNIGVSWSGNTHVGNQGVADYLKSLDSFLWPNASICDVAVAINEECKRRGVGKEIECQVGGYEDGEQSLYQISKDTVTLKNLNHDMGKKSLCIIWGGEKDVSRKIINGNKPLDIGNGVSIGDDDVPNLSIDEGISYIRAIIRRSCEVLPDVSEPIYDLVIDSEGLHWRDRPSS